MFYFGHTNGFLRGQLGGVEKGGGRAVEWWQWWGGGSGGKGNEEEEKEWQGLKNDDHCVVLTQSPVTLTLFAKEMKRRRRSSTVNSDL